jgi:transketolase
MRNTFINTIIDACRERDDIFILSGDAGLGVFDRFKEEYPDRFRNMGAAEQNTASFAAGLAMTGYKVVVYNIIPFLLYRCYEQLRNDICCQGLPVVLAGIGSGITYAPQGMSHYSVEDLGLVQTLPDLVAISPMDPCEARAAASYALDCTKPVYVRLAKNNEPLFHQQEVVDITSPQIIRAGEGPVIIFHGSIANEVMSAYEILKEKGHAPTVVSVPTVQPLDVAAITGILSGCRSVVCVEEHFINCGLGSMLACLRSETLADWQLTNIGIPHRFIHDVRKTAGLRSALGISAEHVVRAVEAGFGCAQ